MELKPGHRVCFCFCSTERVHLAKVYDGTSNRFLGTFNHPQEITTEELEHFINAKAAEHGLVAVMKIPQMPWNFYIERP